MPYDTALADRVREALVSHAPGKIEEKKMFSGLAFMVNGKMCVNVSGDNLMCRFDPVLLEELADKPGFEPMIMRGKQLSGYCYVNPEGFKTKKQFDSWIRVCLAFNKKAKSSRKK